MLPVTLVGNILRGILPARLQIFLLVKLYAILRARLQVTTSNIGCKVASDVTCNGTRKMALCDLTL